MKNITTVPMQPQPDFLAPHPATTPRSILLTVVSSFERHLREEQYPCHPVLRWWAARKRGVGACDADPRGIDCRNESGAPLGSVGRRGGPSGEQLQRAWRGGEAYQEAAKGRGRVNVGDVVRVEQSLDPG